MARRLLLNETTMAAIVEAVAAGLPYEAAAQRAGISPSTLSSWLRRARSIEDNPEPNECPVCAAFGEDPCRTANDRPARGPHAGRFQSSPEDQRFLTLLRALQKAESDAHLEAMLTIRRAWLDKWQAAAWYLERKYPAIYGRRRVEVSGPNEEPMPIAVDKRQTVEWIMEHAQPPSDPAAAERWHERVDRIASDIERNPLTAEQRRRMREAGVGEGLSDGRIVELLLRDIPTFDDEGPLK